MVEILAIVSDLPTTLLGEIMKTLFTTLLIICGLSLFSCGSEFDGEDGEDGNQGETGITGQDGQDGIAGQNGEDGQVAYADEPIYVGYFCGRTVLRFGPTRHWVMYTYPIELTEKWYNISSSCKIRLYAGLVETR